MIRLRLATLDDSSMLQMWADDVDLWTSSDEDGSFDWDSEIPRTVDWRELLVAEHDGRPIGFIQITDAAREESHYWGDVEQGAMAIDIWIGDPVDRNQGFGSKMMQLAIARCYARDGARSILIDPLDANERACRFYERLGFTFVEKRNFGRDLCRVYRLDRS
ncbi:MAG: GNAT family N-acetyltransferase [Ilumatobacteraceae bacterium]